MPCMEQNLLDACAFTYTIEYSLFHCDTCNTVLNWAIFMSVGYPSDISYEFKLTGSYGFYSLVLYM